MPGRRRDARAAGCRRLLRPHSCRHPGPLLRAPRGRELAEETGILADTVIPGGNSPVHIDIHPIHANAAKAEPDHRHIDFRFLFRTEAEVGRLQTEEVVDAAWRDLDSIDDPNLQRRIAQILR
ncbi:NUDIX domain-containing protein [Streptomyces sp. NPDC055299]